jgi:hypothetical protein
MAADGFTHTSCATPAGTAQPKPRSSSRAVTARSRKKGIPKGKKPQVASSWGYKSKHPLLFHLLTHYDKNNKYREDNANRRSYSGIMPHAPYGIQAHTSPGIVCQPKNLRRVIYALF